MVYHVTIVASEHGKVKKYGPSIIGYVQRTVGSFYLKTMKTLILIYNYLNYLTLAMIIGQI